MGEPHHHGTLLVLSTYGQIGPRPVARRLTRVNLRWRVVALLGTLWLSTTPAFGKRLNLPNLGEASNTVLSRRQERELGAAFMRHARRTLPILHDPELQSYIQHFGERLVHASDQPKAYFHFFIIRSRIINSFSVPGAYVGINSGLILDTRNEDELAAVLSHEIAHVTQNHIARLLAQEQRLSLPTMAAMLAGILLTAAQPEAGGAVLTTASAASVQSQLDSRREFEAEADRVGIQTLARAGFNPRAMPDFFERLEDWSRLNDADAPPPFLQDHPVTSKRISQSLNRASRYPNTPMKDDLAFELIRAKIGVDTAESGDAALDQYREMLARHHYRYRQAAEYGEGLAWLRLGRFGHAQATAAALATQHPDVLAYQIMEAEVATASGNYTGALAIYRTALQRYPHSGPALELYVEQLLNARQPQTAVTVLRRLLKRHPRRARLYRMMARATADTGDSLTSHRALSDYYYLDDQPQAAIEQLHLAASDARAHHNSYMLARITARIAEIKQEVKEAPPLPN